MMKQFLKITLIIFWTLLSVHAVLIANTPQQHFEQGNLLYNQGEYQQALAVYQKIADMDYTNGPLYFNMGNCYYKLGDVSRAILHYERARKILPRDEDLKANLAIAQLSVVDKIVPSTDFILIQAYHAFLTFLPKTVQLGVILLAYVLLMVGIILFILAKHPIGRFVGNRMIWIFGVLFVIFTSAYALRLSDEKNHVEAIIMADKVDVMSAPTGGVELFGLHAGTKVRLDQSTGDWVEIILPDRKVGWVKQEVLERI